MDRLTRPTDPTERLTDRPNAGTVICPHYTPRHRAGRADFTTAMRRVLRSASEHDLDLLVRLTDADGDGRVDGWEFVRLLLAQVGAPRTNGAGNTACSKRSAALSAGACMPDK